MKKAVLLSMVLSLTGCATVLRTGSISEAYKNYEAQKYEDTLRLIRQANSVEATGPETRAELTYLKAQTYEKMGQIEKATTLYEYLKEQRADSQYGYLAKQKLLNL